MDARTLERKINYLGMEKSARRILIVKKLAKAEEVAAMTCVEVCEKLLETYEVVSCDDKNITIVRKEIMKTHNDIVKFLADKKRRK